jgi:toxin CcdB
MAQFAVHANRNPRTREAIPYLLDVQSDLLSVLATRLVVPLYRPSGRNLAKLTPEVRFQGQSLVAMVPEMAGVPGRDLGPPVGEVAAYRNQLLGAIDLLLTGF